MKELNDYYLDFGIDKDVIEFCSLHHSKLRERFEKIDETAGINQLKVISAMQKQGIFGMLHGILGIRI